MIIKLCASAIAVFFLFFASAQIPASLRTELSNHIAAFNGKIGVSLIDLDTGDTLTFNDRHCYPTMSTYKFSQAVYVLHQCDRGIISTDQTIHIEKSDLHPGTWSPLRDLYPEGNVDVTIDSLLTFSVSLSDNNVCDVLFDRIGSPKKVNQYLHKNGFCDMNVVATEYEMGELNHDFLYENCSSPGEMSRLLQAVYTNKLLSEKSTELLLRKLEQTSTGSNRLKSGITEGTRLLHKTGTGGSDSDKKILAVNDVGILIIPTTNGEKHLALSVFVSESYESFETTEFIIGKIAAIVCSEYQQQPLIKREAVYFNEETNRSVPVLTYESRKSNGKVVLLSGGYQSQLGEYDFIAEKLALEGYLVIDIQHDLEDDPGIATGGNIYEQRLPIWQRGDSTLLFIRSIVQLHYPKLDWNNLVLIGHSNGGDISVLASKLHPELIEKVITLDHRRMPIPRSSEVPVLTLRGSDFPADPGVLPNKSEAEKYGHIVMELGNGAKHNDLCDNGSDVLKEQILRSILDFLQP